MGQRLLMLIAGIVLSMSVGCSVYKVPPGSKVATVKVMTNLQSGGIRSVDGQLVIGGIMAGMSKEVVQITPGTHTLGLIIMKWGQGMNIDKEISIPEPGNYILHIKPSGIDYDESSHKSTTYVDIQLEKVD